MASLRFFKLYGDSGRLDGLEECYPALVSDLCLASVKIGDDDWFFRKISKYDQIVGKVREDLAKLSLHERIRLLEKGQKNTYCNS